MASFLRAASVAACAAIVTFTSAPEARSDMPAPVVPEILLTPGDGSIRIEGVVSGTGPADITATLAITHKGSGGNMSTRQSRDISLKAEDFRTPVATTGINFGSGSYLSVDLEVTFDDKVIAETHTVIGWED
ncbi:hypothetical protein SAMN04490248_12818 [Salinihabitans flavidus]|uniref:Uncharacterized protein n=1 Tax=Salinihabitans flavidus TaxID=569882 RepID=A0A1H8VDW5_9RHOB|nr:curli-like amyloid fiber formation chaperone CsgH [Salinihabitans flavidus]SEP13652.1 hypothetical protein SAMN04490248_12818 [Salinihabitans flavidus]